MNRPATIFKYEPFTLRTIQNLKSSSLFFGSPRSFNDPYDCALTIQIAEMTRDELEAFRAEVLAQAESKNPGGRTTNISLEDFDAQARIGAQIAIENARDDFLQNNGVTCFSETNSNLLMWSHYGGQYKGYCLEFRTEFEPFNKIEKVQYVTEMPRLQLWDVFQNEGDTFISQMFCTKSSNWAYEREWRGMHQKAGTLFAYPREALKAIYFGPEISFDDRDLLCNIVYCQFQDVELWVGKRISNDFRVEFEPIRGYIPYAEARRRRLLE